MKHIQQIINQVIILMCIKVITISNLGMVMVKNINIMMVKYNISRKDGGFMITFIKLIMSMISKSYCDIIYYNIVILYYSMYL